MSTFSSLGCVTHLRLKFENMSDSKSPPRLRPNSAEACDAGGGVELAPLVAALPLVAGPLDLVFPMVSWLFANGIGGGIASFKGVVFPFPKENVRLPVFTENPEIDARGPFGGAGASLCLSA